MLHLSFKRYLIILAPCILLIGIVVPLKTFAASPTHQAVSKNAVVTLVTLTATNRCVVEGAQTIVTLNKGQEIEGSAVMTSSEDGNHEEEALVLYELHGSGAILVKANSGSQKFEFSVQHNNDQIQVCYAQINMDDESDFNLTQAQFLAIHAASVKYEVEQANYIENEISNN